MALRFIDSFDHYPYSAMFQKWDSTSSGVDQTIGVARFGNGYYTSFSKFITKIIDTQPTFIVGFAFYMDNPPTAGGMISQMNDGATTQVELRIDGSRKLYVTRNGTTLGSVGATTLAVDVWNYIEWKATIHNSTGVIAVRLNGVSEISLTSQDTQNTANASVDRIIIGAPGDSTFVFDDFYLCDATGSAPTNDFLGDIRVEALYPNANGNSSAHTGSDGNSTDNYLLVDETQSDGDTTYVESSNIGDKDTYGYTNLTSATATVYGVQILPYSRKTDAGSRSIATVARHSGSEVDGSNKALTTTYQYHFDIRETKPGGGSWSVSDVNGAEFGVKVA